MTFDAETFTYAAVVAVGLALVAVQLLAEPDRARPKHRRPRPSLAEVADRMRLAADTLSAAVPAALLVAVLSIGLLAERIRPLNTVAMVRA